MGIGSITGAAQRAAAKKVKKVTDKLGESYLPRIAHKMGSDTPMDIFRWQHWDRYFPNVKKPSLRAYLRAPAKYGDDQDEFIRATTGDNVLFTQPKEGQMGLYGKENQGTKEIMQGPEIPPMYKSQEAKYDIHTYPNKYKPNELVQESGYKAPELSRGAKYEYEPQQFDFWKELQSVLNKKE